MVFDVKLKIARSCNTNWEIYKIKKETKIKMGKNSRKLVIEKFDENFVINRYLSIIS